MLDYLKCKTKVLNAVIQAKIESENMIMFGGLVFKNVERLSI